MEGSFRMRILLGYVVSHLLVAVNSFSFVPLPNLGFLDDADEEPVTSFNRTGVESQNVIKISEDAFSKLGSALDLNALQEMLGIPDETAPEPRLSPKNVLRIQKSGKLISLMDISDRYIANPKRANCRPQKQVVDLGLENTLDVTYFPTCIRIKQCGGCCPEKDLLSCQPIASKRVVVRVLKLMKKKSSSLLSRERRRGRQRRESEFEYKKMNVTVEEHTDCSCMCKLSAGECNTRVHYHDEQTCSCVCKNKDEEEKCRQKATHYWDQNTCKCYCKKELKCSTNIKFDHKSCSCVGENTRINVRDFYLRSSNPLMHVLRTGKPFSVPISHN